MFTTLRRALFSTARVRINRADPPAYVAMASLDKYINEGTKLTPIQKELIKIRASQINGCAPCLNIHSRMARAAGETEQRIYLLNAWRESGSLFSEEERAMLDITEQVTNIKHGGISDESYAAAAKLFDEQQLAQIIMTAVAINAWNRIGVSTRVPPSPEKK